MGYELDKLNEGPRSERRAKRKKVNRILNILIVLVVVMIVFFGGKLIFGDKNVDDSVASKQTNQPANDNGKAASDPSDNKENEPEEITDEANEQTKEDTKSKSETPEGNEEEKTTESDESEVITEGDPESNIVKTIVNHAWKPIGTEQAEPHTTNFETGSVDRNEMEMATSYATGFDRSDMVVWWLGRNGGNSITATVSSKTTKQVLKVYLDWVPNEGWKPTKIEELKENDSETYKNYKTSEPDEDENEPDEDED